VGERAFQWLVLGAIVVFGAAVRLAAAGTPLDYYDEVFTVLAYVERPLGESLVNYSTPNNHLLNTLLAHLSVSAFGHHVWAIRLPVVVAGILTIPASYAVGRALDSRGAGLLAAAFTASSMRLVAFSAQARGYALQGFLLLAMVLVAIQILRLPRLRWTATFSVLAALGAYAVPTMVYGIGIAIVWMAGEGIASRSGAERRSLLAHVGLAAILTGCLTAVGYWPVVQHSGFAAVAGNRFVHSL
jgi:4-amino-4-deoxy-L-arabinose transferase-like glycosyltransferase